MGRIQIGYIDNADIYNGTEHRMPRIKHDLIQMKSIFIIHGRDVGFLSEVKEYFSEIGHQPIILSEIGNQSKTIIEKLEDSAEQVSAAIALFSPEDIGRYTSDETEKYRVRQNILFELGYFFGILGRKNVIVLMKGNIHDYDIPTDLLGITVIFFNEKWKNSIVKELFMNTKI